MPDLDLLKDRIEDDELLSSTHVKLQRVVFAPSRRHPA